MQKHDTREAWLEAAIAALRPLFAEEAGIAEFPVIRVSVGLPKGKSAAIGQCWPSSAAEDAAAQIFISPVVTKPAQALEVLVHEIVHAVDDCTSKHRGKFIKIARAVGLQEPWTATTASEMLASFLAEVAEELGDYPHAAMVFPEKAVKKQTTRMLKLWCPDCEYTVRTTKKWIDIAVPKCPVDDIEMDYEKPDEDEEGN